MTSQSIQALAACHRNLIDSEGWNSGDISGVKVGAQCVSKLFFPGTLWFDFI